MDVQTLKTIIKTVIIVFAVIGVICLLAGIDDDEVMIVGCSISGFALMLWINYVISTYFYHVATEKGYYEACYLLIPFLLSMIGYILVAALPDRGNKEMATLKSDKESLSDEQPVEQEKLQQEYTCPSCRNSVCYGDTSCKCCGQAFNWTQI